MKRNYLCRILAVLMVLAFALTGLVGCKKDGNESKVESGDNNSKQEEELKLVTLSHYVMMGEQSDKDYVMKELNEYLGNSAIKVNIDLHCIPQGEYNDRLTAAFSTGGDVDLLYTDNSTFSYTQHAGAEDYAPLTALLEKHGSAIKDALPDWAWDAVKVGDEIYGVPMNKELVSIKGVLFNQTMADHLGMTDELANFQWNFLQDWDELIYKFKNARDTDTTGRIEGVQEDNADGISNGFQEAKSYAMFSGTQTDMGFWWGLDEFAPGVGTNVKEINFFSSVADDETAFSAYETPEFAELAKTLGRWYDDVIQRGEFTDYVTNWNWLGNGLVPLNTTSGRVKVVEKDILNPNTNTVPYKMGLNLSEYADATRSHIQAACTAISAESKNAERAMMYMNLLWSDSYVNTVLRFGVEGRHWDDNGDGTIHLTAQGGNGNTWYSWYGTQFGGNMFIVKIPDTQPEGLLNALYDMNKEAEKYSTKIGFNFDSTPVTASIAACADPIDTYKNMFVGAQCGSKDVDEYLTKFKTELNSNGINDVVAEVQKQLNAYLGK